MDFSRSTTNPHSFAEPELARVKNTNLELIVDFDNKVLKGKAILTIKRKSSASEIILDNLELIISDVTNVLDGKPLRHRIVKCSAFGSLFCVELPAVDIYTFNPECKIQIEYKTTENSPALHWLTPAQTADGKHHFLLSHNKLIYARAWFPCQDTPSVKSTYTAKISVPKNYRVLMSAILNNEYKSGELNVYEFHQMNPVPSHAVIIAVGSLEERKLNAKSNIFAESEFIRESIDTFETNFSKIERMLEIAESVCGSYFWDRYDICVLPRSIAHFEIECPCVTFIPPTLLYGDFTCVGLFARNISQSWAGNLVTCCNYENLWLNKSFNIFISRKIESKLLTEILFSENPKADLTKINHDIKNFLQCEELDDLQDMVLELEESGSLKCLKPNLTNLLPYEATEYVPYEWGCVLLTHLEYMLELEKSSVFEPFLKSYFLKFAFKSINTQDWIKYLYLYFSDKKEKKILYDLTLDKWLYDIVSLLMVPLFSSASGKTEWEAKCFDLAEGWVKWNCKTDRIPPMLIDERHPCDAEKIIFLSSLHFSYKSLTIHKLRLISYRYAFDCQNAKIRCLWLLLCIKVRWIGKVGSALYFASQNYSPDYVCRIFQYLYEWIEMRPVAIKTYMKNKEKMLCETQKELAIILHLN
ncbi:leukotriene A-4 hydrolase-like [Temnothorax nylanderi]|uniref:leukotriene A-4 hydrolase-like n=1 Tax=Temnothorax nylanderi TaxID=102681 RepID=UPI003A8C18E2